jgi:succinoglycan biosynthesis transport protein ExoP
MVDEEFLEETPAGRFTAQDYWQAMIRQRWWLLVPLFLCGWLGFAAARRWPYVFRSEALVLVVHQRVPEQYVTPNVVSDLQDRLQSMTQQILSRTRLQRLIEQFNLYPSERAHEIMEDVVDQMRRDIRIEPVEAPGKPGELTAFRISYAARNPHVAQQITNELTSLFIEENLQSRTQASVGTTTFLESQLEQAAKDLAAQEQRQREYKMRYLGELPEQEQSNLQILSSLEAQLNSSTDALSRAEQQKVYLESLRNEYQAMQKTMGLAAAGSRVSPVAAAEATLSELRRHLADLEAVYTPQYPDVIRTKEKIAQWEALTRKLEAGPPPGAGGQANAGGAAGQSPAPPHTKGTTNVAASTVAEDQALVEVNSRLKAISLEMEDRQKEINTLRARIHDVQSHLNLTPVREQQLAEVTRAYQNAQEYYQSLLKKKLQSELATNLEERQQGEQFRILDPASLPEKPDEPNPLEIILLGWGSGLCVGIGLMLVREFRDQTLRSEREIESTRVAILARIPNLRTLREQKWQRWRRSLEVAAVSVAVMASVGAAVYLGAISSVPLR